MLIPIDRLRPDTTPVRRRQWPDDDNALRESMKEMGQLDALLVIRLGDDFDETPNYEVKDGNRRLAAARALGWMAMEVAELPRNKPDFTLAAATAANVVRAPLDPVDQWQAIVTLQERGYTLPGAAACLGLTERHAAQLDRLGRLHPDVLALIAETSLPTESQLRTIAGAPPDLQKRALTTKGAIEGHKLGKIVRWHLIVGACARHSIPRAHAIFDTATAGVAFTQDLFAPAGSDEEWTTADVPGFLAAQRAALEAQAATSKGRLVVVEEAPRAPGSPALPKGWRPTYGKPDAPTRRETVFACVSAHTGAVVRATALDEVAEKAAQAKKAAEAKSLAKAKAALDPALPATPSALGPAAPSAMPAGDTDPGRGEEEAEDDAPDTDQPEPPAPARDARHPLTKAGQEILARAKSDGLRARLRATQPAPEWDELVALLILALHADNVKIAGYQRPDDGADWREAAVHGGGADLVRRIVTPAGHLQYDEAELQKLAMETLARTLWISAADAGYHHKGSGPVAEWIGATLDAQKHMPRLDTEALLATADAATLKNAAAIAQVKFTTATAAKRDLVGKVHGWTPTFAHYGAPGPKPAGRDAA